MTSRVEEIREMYMGKMALQEQELRANGMYVGKLNQEAQTKKVCKKALRKNGSVLRFIHNPTPEMKQIAENFWRNLNSDSPEVAIYLSLKSDIEDLRRALQSQAPCFRLYVENRMPGKYYEKIWSLLESYPLTRVIISTHRFAHGSHFSDAYSHWAVRSKSRFLSFLGNMKIAHLEIENCLCNNMWWHDIVKIVKHNSNIKVLKVYPDGSESQQRLSYYLGTGIAVRKALWESWIRATHRSLPLGNLPEELIRVIADLW